MVISKLIGIIFLSFCILVESEADKIQIKLERGDKNDNLEE